MPDDKLQTSATPTGRPDHDRVTVDQGHEIEALMAKHKKTEKQVLQAIRKAGPMRVQIERALRK